MNFLTFYRRRWPVIAAVAVVLVVAAVWRMWSS